ncbi:cholesterol 7-desaturase nvd [Chiloscyllium plagiosum]|uniref:cholesterol 7-desaturase nvd n=1 Tax=Chiloscyllium plagiosum TaxID=36176 RepID=UPI001CB804D2|nr:cholesterol 7-desaturase nvd [Chiloscyllium plagiosum]
MPLELGSGWFPGLVPALTLLLPALAVLLALRLCLAPLQLLRAPHQVGYIPEPGTSRSQAAADVRRRRKRGELPPVYPNGWYRLVDSQELRRGQVKNVTIFGEQVAVYRGQDGQAYVVDAYCPHLGANLAVGGQVIGNCIECPFHGWQFRGEDGKCVKIPYAEKVPDFAKIKTWPSCELNCAVFVWFHCDGVDPSWSVPEQEEIQSGEWVYRGRTEHYINCHIQEIPENAADIAHLSHLHTPNMLSGSDLRYTRVRLWGFAQHDWKVEWHPEPEPTKHCSRMLVYHSLYILGWHCSLLDVHVVARQVGPGIVYMLFNHSSLGRGVILHCVTPVEPLLQRVSHRIYYQANIPPIVPKFILKAECVQFERDVMVWNNKKYVSKPLLVKEDSAIARHRRWYAQFYSPKSPRLTMRHDDLEW